MADAWPAFDVDPRFADLRHASPRQPDARQVARRPCRLGQSRLARDAAPRRCRPGDAADRRRRRPDLHAGARPLPPRHRAEGQRRRAATRCRLDGPEHRRLHRGLVAMLDRHGLPSTFHGRPNEIAEPCRSPTITAPRRYDPQFGRTCCATPGADRAGVRTLPRRDSSARRARCISSGAASISPSPAFRAATAPPHPGGIPGLPDRITREAYSHEVSSAGFWPGGVVAAEPFFYSYAYPEPPGFREAPVDRPAREIRRRRSANSSCPMRRSARRPIRRAR